MTNVGHSISRHGLDLHGLTTTGQVHWNLTPSELYEYALRREEGVLCANGAIVCATGERTGRSPADKYVVEEGSTRDDIWWGAINRPMSEAQFDRLHRRVIDHFRTRRVFVRDMYAGADPATRLPIRVINEFAWHNLFACQLFIRPKSGTTTDFRPKFTILCAPSCLADPKVDGTRSPIFVVLNFARQLVLIGGTQYAGEMKKSIFTVMNYLLPTSGVLSMHCAANAGASGDVALFFGLSGTGKTTLSADPDRRLIGDDEHGWNDSGVFNIEGGCYAKCIKLSREREPQIYDAVRFGAVMENVVLRENREPDFDSEVLTENTRAAYPLEYIPNAVIPSTGGHPKHVLFLTCDAFGVLPPISRLNSDQAMYHFLSGYTAKVAGTEAGVTEPQATFSTCFGAPFLPLPPQRYATMLAEKIAAHGTRCWLVNTGWSGGPVGVGKRLSLGYTRAMVKAAISGALESVQFAPDRHFGIEVPKTCPEVPAEVLTPRSTWRDPAAYDGKAKELLRLFEENYKNIDVAQSTAG